MQQSLRREVFIRWLALPASWICLNSNGASKGDTGLAGGGGIFRDFRGSFIRAYSTNFGTCLAYKAEIFATTLGLEIAYNLDVTKLVLQMDNQACIEVFQNADYHGGEGYHLINFCRSLNNSSDWKVV